MIIIRYNIYTRGGEQRNKKTTIRLADVGKIFSGTYLGKLADVLDNFIYFDFELHLEMNQAIKGKLGQAVTRNCTIVMDFVNDQDHIDIVAAINDNKVGLEVSLLSSRQPGKLNTHTELLIEDAPRKRTLRSGRKYTTNASKAEADTVILVYPFGDKNRINLVAHGLKELSNGGNEDQVLIEQNHCDESTSDHTKSGIISDDADLSKTQTNQRSPHISIKRSDLKILATNEWLNDSLIDLWMQLISRNIHCKGYSNTHFFSTHFYTKLLTEGVKQVESWTSRNNIDIFEKRLIFIPINLIGHWSLCVIVNPGAISTSVNDDEDDTLLPCMLFFDSLNMHSRIIIHNKLMKWLNSEWKRLKEPGEEPFNRESYKMYKPAGTYGKERV